MQQDNKLYKALNLERFQIPSSSYLYSLQPLGIGTPSVESLSGYIARLAEAHCVFPGILMERVIAQFIKKEYSSANLHKIYGFTGALNGTGVMAIDLIQALETLTCNQDLYQLTLVNLSELLPSRNLLRFYRAWCPKCYCDRRSLGAEIYESLLWAIKAVTICPYHGLPLLEKCFSCGCKNLHLAWVTRPGYCSKCGNWLGDVSSSSESNNHQSVSENALKWHLWVANNLGGLIAKSAFVKTFFSKEKLAHTFKAYAETIAQGNLAALARQLQIPKNTFWLWCQGKNQPSIEALLHVSYCLDVPLIDLLTQETNAVPCKQPPPRDSLPISKSTAGCKPFDFDRVRQYLEAVLESDENPPPSMEEVAKRINCNRRTIYRHLRDLCHQISTRYINYRKASYTQAVSECCEEIKEAVRKLHNEGKYPSEALVGKLISQPGYLRYKPIRFS